jgi:alkylhydroperoxidase family enzyme
VARYAYPSIDNLPEPLAKEIRARVTPGRGNVWRMLLWSPDTAEKFIDYSEAVRHRNAIPPKIRELMILRTGHLCDAPYEVHHHKRISREVGLTEAMIDAAAVGPTAAALDDAQRFALKMVDELIADKQLSQATFDKAIKDYGVKTVVDMILMVGFYTMACMYMKSFGIEIEQAPK